MKLDFDGMISFIGNTPLLELPLEKIFPALNWDSVEVFAKMELFNPYGSIKDRTAWSMIRGAMKTGLLSKDSQIIEPTSGNTGIGLAWISRMLGYNCTIVMPENVSVERKQILRLLGATLVLTPAKEGMVGAIERAQDLVSSNKNAIMLDQFSNPENVNIHYSSTAVEIWNSLEGDINGFVAGIGTGGTITGVGKFLKEKNDSIKVVGVLPVSFPHGIQGIGAGFQPKILDLSVVDEIVRVEEAEVFDLALRLSAKFGIFVGISSAAALLGFCNYFAKNRLTGKWVVIFPDGGQKYISVLDAYKNKNKNS